MEESANEETPEIECGKDKGQGQVMTRKVDEKWRKTEAELPEQSRPLLRQLRADYTAAAKLHVPTWTGGPSAEILAELIRQGWHK
jgi:hypothetical protein